MFIDLIDLTSPAMEVMRGIDKNIFPGSCAGCFLSFSLNLLNPSYQTAAFGVVKWKLEWLEHATSCNPHTYSELLNNTGIGIDGIDGILCLPISTGSPELFIKGLLRLGLL